jgi:hypothetical protein
MGASIDFDLSLQKEFKSASTLANLTSLVDVIYFDSTCTQACTSFRLSKHSLQRAEIDCAGVAQLAEQLFCKQQVIGSSPFVGSVTSELKALLLI